MRQAQISKAGKIEIIESKIPTVNNDEVLIKVKYCGICGTDMHIFHGGFDSKFPVVPGHEFSGEVIAVGKNCKRIKPGMKVAVEPNIPCNNCELCLNNQHNYCKNMITPGVTHDGGFGEYVSVKELAVFDIGELPYKLGALVEPLSCVIHGINKLDVKTDSKVLILGAGPIGLMLGYTAKAKGAKIIDFLDIDKFRLRTAKNLDFNNTYINLEEINKKYEIVIDATGYSPVVGDAIKKLSQEGQLLVFGVPSAESKLTLDHYYIFKNEIQVIGALTSRKDSFKALSFLQDHSFEMSNLITHILTLEDFVKFMKGEMEIENNMKVLVEL